MSQRVSNYSRRLESKYTLQTAATTNSTKMPRLEAKIRSFHKDQLIAILDAVLSQGSTMRNSVSAAVLLVETYESAVSHVQKQPMVRVPDTESFDFDIYEMPSSDCEPEPAPQPELKAAPKARSRLKTTRVRTTNEAEAKSGGTRQSQRLKLPQKDAETKLEPRLPEKRKLEKEQIPLFPSISNANIQSTKPTKKAKTESEKQINCTLCGDLFYQVSNGPGQCLKDRYHPGKLQVAPIWDKWLGGWKGDKSFNYFTYVEDFPQGFSWSCCSGIGSAVGCTGGLGFHSYLDKPCTIR
ncbi:hypothetical protein TWF694_011579 [Orbilia ellipsospora]|uniref:Uncharacterized protein n=1 Tax=Orbilia ellipsospora TaxID=2528407 RepID=A0AAV9X5M1_9PEZI